MIFLSLKGIPTLFYMSSKWYNLSRNVKMIFGRYLNLKYLTSQLHQTQKLSSFLCRALDILVVLLLKSSSLDVCMICVSMSSSLESCLSFIPTSSARHPSSFIIEVKFTRCMCDLCLYFKFTRGKLKLTDRFMLYGIYKLCVMPRSYSARKV